MIRQKEDSVRNAPKMFRLPNLSANGFEKKIPTIIAIVLNALVKLTAEYDALPGFENSSKDFGLNTWHSPRAEAEQRGELRGDAGSTIQPKMPKSLHWSAPFKLILST